MSIKIHRKNDNIPCFNSLLNMNYSFFIFIIKDSAESFVCKMSESSKITDIEYSNCLFFPTSRTQTPKNIQFTITEDEENQQIFTFWKL